MRKFLYTKALKPILFKLDPEFVHDRTVILGSLFGRYALSRNVLGFIFKYKNKLLKQDIAGIHFENPIGLSAGFDKNAELMDILPSVGFGFAEIGSVTGKACSGNSKPRLWRLKKSRSIVVHYGLKNDGSETIAERLRSSLQSIPIGVSVAMTNCQDNVDIDNAIMDYVKAFRDLEALGSYVTINISCPNTLGGQPFIDPDNLTKLLDELDTIPTTKPIFIKLSPDLNDNELDRILEVAHSRRIQGIICTNLTKRRTGPDIHDTDIPEKGGLSGKVVQEQSDRMLASIYRKSKGRFVLVGNGGVFTAEDAYKKIRLGASLVQILTGMIFEGPGIVRDINKGLAELLKRDGFTHISQAIGIDNK